MPIAVRSLSLAAPLLAAVIGIVAVKDPLLALIGSVAVVFAVVLLVDFAIGICLFAFASALFEGIPEFGAFSAAKAIGAGLAVSWLATVAYRQTLRDEIVSGAPYFSALLVVFALWCGASTLWAEDSSVATSQFTRLALNLLLIPIIYSAVKEVRTLKLLILGLLIGLLLSALYGLFFTAGVTEGQERLAGSGLDANYLALWLITACTLAYGILAGERDFEMRALVLAAIGISALAAFATASRTGLVALAAILLVAPLLAGGGRRVLAIAVSVLAVAGGTVYFTAFASDTVREHVSSRSDGGSGRTDIWKVGLRMAEANAAVGVGVGNFRGAAIHYLLEPGAVRRSEHIVDKPKVAHNTMLQWFAEIGVPGALMFLALMGGSFLMALRAARRFASARLHSEELLSRAVAVALVGVFAGSFFISLQDSKPLWMLIALGPVVLKLANRQARAE